MIKTCWQSTSNHVIFLLWKIQMNWDPSTFWIRFKLIDGLLFIDDNNERDSQLFKIININIIILTSMLFDESKIKIKNKQSKRALRKRKYKITFVRAYRKLFDKKLHSKLFRNWNKTKNKLFMIVIKFFYLTENWRDVLFFLYRISSHFRFHFNTLQRGS